LVLIGNFANIVDPLRPRSEGIDIPPLAVRIAVMLKTLQEDFLYKKIYEFSYATFRIGESAKNKEIAELLESKAVSLLDSILVADYEKTKNMVYSIITLTGLLVDSGTLHPVNREVLIRESERINLAIEALPKMKRETLPDLNLGKIFSKTVKLTKQEIQSEIADKDSADRIADKNFADEIADKSEIRQSAIIEQLQQRKNCRLNELQAVFPDVSERTLRYDLESLISKGFVERVGSRRNSFYKIKNSTSAVIELPEHSGHLAKNPGFTQ